MVSLSLSLSFSSTATLSDRFGTAEEEENPSMKWSEVKGSGSLLATFLLCFLAPNEHARFSAGVIHLPQSSSVAEIRANESWPWNGPLHTRDWEPVTITLQALSLVEKVGPVQVHFTLGLEGGTNGVCECKMDGKVYVDSYVASVGSCFMVTWTGFQNHLVEVDLTQNRSGDHGTPNAHNYWFILFYHTQGSTWIEIHQNSIWLRFLSHTTSHYTWGSVTALHGFGGVIGQSLDTFFWVLTMSWSWLLAHVWSGPKSQLQPLLPLSPFLSLFQGDFWV